MCLPGLGAVTKTQPTQYQSTVKRMVVCRHNTCKWRSVGVSQSSSLPLGCPVAKGTRSQWPNCQGVQDMFLTSRPPCLPFNDYGTHCRDYLLPPPPSLISACRIYPLQNPLGKLRKAETMADFHRCLERAGVPCQHVEFPSAGGSSLLAAQTEIFGTATAETPAATATPAGCSERDLSRDGATNKGVSETRQHTSKGAEHSERGRHPQPPPHPGLGLWCHPGDVERVRFCVCGGRRRGGSSG